MIEPLYSFQKDAVDRAAKGEAIYLGFDPGLGKSRTALVTAMNRGAKRLLVICPASGRYVWEAEARKWINCRVRMIASMADLAKLKGDGIFVITYGLLSQKEGPFATAIAKGAPFDMTVIDEAAAVKNSGANRTKAILGKMLPKLGYVLPLSGTPAPNHAGELYPILKALYPQAIRNGTGRAMLEWEFQDVFCKVVKKRFGTGREVRVIEGSKNVEELRRRISPFMMRVKKEDVLKDLPPVRYDVVPLLVNAAPVTALTGFLDPNVTDEEFLKFFSGATGDQHVMRVRRILGLAKAAPAIEYIDEFMQNLPQGKKLLVFAHHREVVGALVKGLGDWSPVVLFGSNTSSERTAAVNMFLHRPECRIFVGNIQAAGTGLTLVGPDCDCSDVIFVEASYSVGDNVQAAARVHRIGQKNAVVARFLTAHGTIDDRIQEILARKATDFWALFN